MEQVNHFNYYHHTPKRGVSWRAIFAGTITVLSILLVLNLIGLSIGLGVIEPTEEKVPFREIGTGSIIWWVVSNLIALFTGAFVSARVGVSLTGTSGIVQGIMTWALYTILSVIIITSAVGNIISGVGNAVGGVLSATGDIGSEILGPQLEEEFEELDISLEQAKEEFYAHLKTQPRSQDQNRAGSTARTSTSNVQGVQSDSTRTSQSSNAEIEEVFGNAKNILGGSYNEVDKQALVDILVERTDMNQTEAEQTVDNYLARYENLRRRVDEFLTESKEEAIRHGENIAEAGSEASIYLAMALILGAIVAAIGGFVGTKNLRDDYERKYYISEMVAERRLRRDIE